MTTSPPPVPTATAEASPTEFEESLDESTERYILKLYVAGMTSRHRLLQQTFRRVGGGAAGGRHRRCDGAFHHEHGKIALDRRALDFSQLVRRTAAVFAERESEHPFSVNTIPVWIDGDAVRIEQIVSNIIGNAVKYTPVAGKVSISLNIEGDDAVLRVQDDGFGITTDLLPHIFDLFVRGERTLDRLQVASGLASPWSVDSLSSTTGPSRYTAMAQVAGASLRCAHRRSPRSALPVRLATVRRTTGIAVTGPGQKTKVLLVALTGYGTPDALERSRRAGFHHHLIKPVNPEALYKPLTGEPTPRANGASGSSGEAAPALTPPVAA